jgi:hypothetical protein
LDGNGFCLWDLEKKCVMKSQDVIFDNCSFPYGSKLATSPSPIQVKISWPPLTSAPDSSDPVTPPIPNPAPPALDVPIPDRPDPEPASMADAWSHFPLLEVPLQPRDN